jgi:ectoine hydroxylase-related dioxygenase (phytanoyl-CoA dioxygenase family)
LPQSFTGIIAMPADTFSSPTLDTPYPLKPDQIEQFREQGFIKLKDVLDQATLDYYGEQITRLTLELNPNKGRALEERDTYDRAFIQVGNLWTHSDIVKRFTFSQRLGQIATELLGVSGVRVYHDQALYKEPAGGFTPWHVDQQYWPMSSSQSVTAWIPLQATPIDMGPLCFGKGSHRKHLGREIAISDESERLIAQEIKKHKIVEVFEPYGLGEVSFHYGWTLHRAGGNTTDQPRKVHTVIYMDQDMKLAEPRNENQKRDWQRWSPSSEVGGVMADPLNPVIFSSGQSSV